ncbi:MAG TPA: hypothetical protein VFH91_05490, partial [Pyrinomonadaceae bacterium]|nr:hypothetical protein [Pyrinomonadaceae bacterium]
RYNIVSERDLKLAATALETYLKSEYWSVSDHPTKQELLHPTKKLSLNCIELNTTQPQQSSNICSLYLDSSANICRCSTRETIFSPEGDNYEFI